MTMLAPASGGVAVIACNTCRRAGEKRADDIRDGAHLVAALRAAQASDPRYAAITVEEMPCLFACEQSCTIHLRAPGKVGYVLGRFTPDEAAATAILDYAAHYAESAQGRVPFKQWPAGVKGHFIVRTPPPGFVTTE